MEKTLKVGSVIVCNPKIGPVRIWEVKSICIGAMYQESLIELRNLTETPGVDTEGRQHKTTWVPEILIRELEFWDNIDEYEKSLS